MNNEYTNDLNENSNLPTPITCPRCQSRELAFVTEYHKAIGMRISFFVFLGIALFIFFCYVSR